MWAPVRKTCSNPPTLLLEGRRVAKVKASVEGCDERAIQNRLPSTHKLRISAANDPGALRLIPSSVNWGLPTRTPRRAGEGPMGREEPGISSCEPCPAERREVGLGGGSAGERRGSCATNCLAPPARALRAAPWRLRRDAGLRQSGGPATASWPPSSRWPPSCRSGALAPEKRPMGKGLCRALSAPRGPGSLWPGRLWNPAKSI